MFRNLALTLWFGFAISLASASAFGAGSEDRYTGHLKSGEAIELVLSGRDGAVTGTLRDDSFAYRVSAEIAGGRLSGRADQSDLGLQLGLSGQMQANGLALEIQLSLFGQQTSEQVWLERSGSGSQAQPPSTHPNPGNATAAASGERDAALVGHWVHEEIYNSGSGASFLGTSSRQGLVLMANGGVADGGSSVSMSGDNYFGQSSGAGGGAVPGVSWFSRDQHLWLHNAADGQTVDLGRYYAEPDRMMITGNNGKRLLFTRAR